MARKVGVCKYEERDYELIYSEAETRIDTYCLGDILADLKDGKIKDDISMQRDGDQWSLKDKSMLMHTVFINLSILPISMVQQGTGNGAVKILSDGKQRVSNFDQFKNNEFALSSITPHVKMKKIVKQPKLDENGRPVKEFIDGKKVVVLEPCRDENGDIITEIIDYKVAGKYYNELPNALKNQFLRYKNMPQYVHINYTPEEMQLQMLRDNTSVKMTPAQIGAVLCGEDLATWLREFRYHDLFLNQSTWTDKQENKSLVERCVIESFVLSVLDGKWNANYLKNVELFNENAGENLLEAYKDLVDDFAQTVSTYPKLKNYLTKDNLHIITAAYRNFLDMSVKYSRKSFAQFLVAWFEEIKASTDYEVDGNAGTKQKTTVLGKLDIINEECVKFMEINGVEKEFVEGEDGDITVSEIANFVKDFAETGVVRASKEMALKTLMPFTSYPFRDFSSEGINKFENWIVENPVDSEKYDDCVWATLDFVAYMQKSGVLNKFSENDIAILIYRTYVDGENLDEKEFISWLAAFENNNNCEQKGDNNSLLEKETFMSNSLEAYIKNTNN